MYKPASPISIPVKTLFVLLVSSQFVVMSGCKYPHEHPSPESQSATLKQSANLVTVDWHARLKTLQGELARDPNSAFLHGQIAVAYDNLNDLPAFDAQIQEAMKLDRKSAIYCYFAYAVYKRRHLDDKKIKVLQQALRIDPDNPLGHYEMASIMEDNGKWSDALAEYDRTKQLLDGVKPNQSSTDYSKWSYADPSGDPYDVTFEKDHIDADITRVRTAVSAAK